MTCALWKNVRRCIEQMTCALVILGVCRLSLMSSATSIISWGIKARKYSHFRKVVSTSLLLKVSAFILHEYPGTVRGPSHQEPRQQFPKNKKLSGSIQKKTSTKYENDDFTPCSCFATAVLWHLNYFELVSLGFFLNFDASPITCVSPRSSHHTIPWFRPTTSTNSFDSKEWRCSHSALAEVLNGPNWFYMLRSADTENRHNKRWVQYRSNE